MNRQQALAEDAALVTRARGGDREAFGGLVRKYAGVVRALVAARLGWGPATEDAAQDAFVQAYTRLDRLEEPSRFAGWISRIAVNQALQTLRREGRRRAGSLDALPSEPAAAPERDHVEQDEEVARMLQAVGTLDEKSQLVLALRFREEMAVKDIAERLGQNPPAVAMRISRALRKLRSELDGGTT